MNTQELITLTTEPEQKQIVESCIAMLDVQGKLKKFDDEQKVAFIMSCRAMRLNPLLNEVYAVPYHDKDNDCDVLGIIPDYKTFLSRAERSGLLDGWQSHFQGDVVTKKVTKKYQDKTTKVWKEYEATEIDTEKTTLSGTITIYRKDWTRPFESRKFNFLTEMENTPFWKDDPYGMLEKQMIRDCFQKVFPKDCDLRDDSKIIKVSGGTVNEITPTPPQSDQATPLELAETANTARTLLNSGVCQIGSIRETINTDILTALKEKDLSKLKEIVSLLQNGDLSRWQPKSDNISDADFEIIAEPEQIKEQEEETPPPPVDNSEIEKLIGENESGMKFLSDKKFQSWNVPSHKNNAIKLWLGDECKKISDCLDKEKQEKFNLYLRIRVKEFQVESGCNFKDLPETDPIRIEANELSKLLSEQNVNLTVKELTDTLACMTELYNKVKD